MSEDTEKSLRNGCKACNGWKDSRAGEGTQLVLPRAKAACVQAVERGSPCNIRGRHGSEPRRVQFPGPNDHLWPQKPSSRKATRAISTHKTTRAPPTPTPHPHHTHSVTIRDDSRSPPSNPRLSLAPSPRQPLVGHPRVQPRRRPRPPRPPSGWEERSRFSCGNTRQAYANTLTIVNKMRRRR